MEEGQRMEGFIFTLSDDQKKKKASRQSRQRGPALHQTLVSSHDPLQLRIYLREKTVLTKKSFHILLPCFFIECHVHFVQIIFHYVFTLA